MNALVRRVGSLLVLVMFLFATPGLSADGTRPSNPDVRLRGLQTQAKTDPLIAVSMEVLALQGLETLQVTPEQMKALAKLAAETAAKPRPRKPSVTSDKYKKKLTALRDALIKHDVDEIQVLTAELGELQTSDKVFVDNMVDITDPARKRAPEVLKLLSPRQVAVYSATFESLLHDPVEGMFLTLESGAKMGPKEWNDLRDAVAIEIGDMLSGLDVNQSKKTAERVVALLDKGHKIKEADLPKSRADLEKEMRQIMGNTGPIEILRHFMERHLALLLSNPQLATAIDARLKNMK
jgi:hypothetical protein